MKLILSGETYTDPDAAPPMEVVSHLIKGAFAAPYQAPRIYLNKKQLKEVIEGLIPSIGLEHTKETWLGVSLSEQDRSIPERWMSVLREVVSVTYATAYDQHWIMQQSSLLAYAALDLFVSPGYMEQQRVSGNRYGSRVLASKTVSVLVALKFVTPCNEFSPEKPGMSSYLTLQISSTNRELSSNGNLHSHFLLSQMSTLVGKSGGPGTSTKGYDLQENQHQKSPPRSALPGPFGNFNPHTRW